MPNLLLSQLLFASLNCHTNIYHEGEGGGDDDNDDHDDEEEEDGECDCACSGNSSCIAPLSQKHFLQTSNVRINFSLASSPSLTCLNL